MNQAEVHRLVSALKFKVNRRPYGLVTWEADGTTTGARQTLENLRLSVNALVINERLEVSQYKGHTVREYTERLIQEAITHGDTHTPTMEMADWWLPDKAAIHKLFKVLVPRLKESPHGYTRIFNSPIQASMSKMGAPSPHPVKSHRPRAVVEIIGHPFPPLAYSNTQANKKMIHNVLLAEARLEVRKQKYAEQAQAILDREDKTGV